MTTTKGATREDVQDLRDPFDPARRWRVRAALGWRRTAGLPLRDHPFNPLLHDAIKQIRAGR